MVENQRRSRCGVMSFIIKERQNVWGGGGRLGCRRIMKNLQRCALALVLICCSGFCREVVDLLPEKPGALQYWTEARSVPRPLKIHFLKVALTASALEVFAIPGGDPDGDGPAESRLTMPMDLFVRHRALAAVNANAFAGLPDDKVSGPDWFEGRPVDIHGTVVSGGKVISPVEASRTSFWLDAVQKPRIGTPSNMSSVAEAVADWFSPLIVDGRMIPDSEDRVLHPRTALGFDNTGTWLLLVVVDGRQPGFSEGVSLFELASILQSQGCSQSVNLDGGGSSVMLIREPGKDAHTVNSPSGKTHRPVPVMLGIREAELP